MKKAIYIIFFVAFFVASYFIIATIYPKYSSYFPLFGVILLLDLYLWFSIRNKIFDARKSISYPLILMYWLPFVALIGSSIISLFYHFQNWDPVLYNYMTGVILVIYISKVFAVIFLFMADIVKVIRHALYYISHKRKKKPQAGKRITRARFLQNIGLVGGGFILSGLIIGMVRWAHQFRIRYVYVPLPELPEKLEGFKIVQLSDMHLGSWTSHAAMEDVVSKVNQLKPDIICFTGDLVNFTTDEVHRYEDALQKLKASKGIYAVLGNHDYGDYVNWDSEAAKKQNQDDLFNFYERMNWKLLNNSHAIIDVRGEQLALMGVENWSAIDRFPRYGDLEKASLGINGVPVRILMSHDPTHWDAVISEKHPEIDLTLAGHTHGFQFGVELKGFRWSPAQYLYRQWAGLYKNTRSIRNQFLYVNRGLGNIGYPGRVGILPEITLLQLSSA